MKKYILLSFVCCVVGLFSSCDYLNVDDYFEDTFKEDSIFSNKNNLEYYYNGAVALLPKEGRLWHWGSTPGVTGSDEAVTCGSFSNGFVEVSFSGTQLTTDRISATSMGGWDWNFNIWPNCYKIIRKMTIALPRINEVPDATIFDKMELDGKLRFLRAYAYYLMVMQYGPVIILGDDVLNTNEDTNYYSLARSTYDECIDYICSEFEKAANGLPTSQPIDKIDAPTRGAALALVARLRLQAASPLFNGGEAAHKYFSNFVRSTDGVHYISQTYDERKWALAAAAAKRVMDLNTYELHVVKDPSYTDKLPANVPHADFPAGAGGIDPFRSYSEMFNGETLANTNPELIWGTSQNINEHLDHVFPLTFGGTGSISVPQRIVDAYYMADGKDIHESSSEYPYEARPYDNTCVTSGDLVLSKNYVLKDKTYKAYANREPRFYVNIGYSNALWTMESTKDGDKKNIVVKYYNGANSGKNNWYGSTSYFLTGYTCKKYVHPRDAKSGSEAKVIDKKFPLIRYAEVLLSYAEALNNLTQPHTVGEETFSRDPGAIKAAFNPIRFRAGLPGLEDADLITAENFNKVIQRERLIELFHEGRRYYDIKRWGIIEELEKEPLTGLNVEQGEWDGFYQPIVIQHRSIYERVFKHKMLLLPIHLDEIRRSKNLDQNPGWEK